MSLRGPRGGRVRGRGSGRGRGRGKTTVWEWESYTPGSEVYDQLWHIRRQPVEVTPRLPTACPLPHARTRILDRRQTEGEIRRNFYIVETRHNADSMSDSGPHDMDTVEIVHVDLSRIQEFVSQHELERFENEQFQIEAEAEAVALRAEAEELARRRLKKNVRVSEPEQGHDSPSAIFNNEQMPPRGRGRGRGRSRGKGRGSWRGRRDWRTTKPSHQMTIEEGLSSIGLDHELIRDEDVQRIIGELDSDSETDELQHEPRFRPSLSASPGLMRSAFIANSALPTSSGVPKLILHPNRTHVSETDDSELDLIDSHMGPAKHLGIYQDSDLGVLSQDNDELDDTDSDVHQSKRRRTENSNTRHPKSPANRRHPVGQPVVSLFDDGDIDEIAETEAEEEEYAVEAILEHYFENGTKYYLVKWEGYADSHDWLSEEELAGAAELVAEYNARVKDSKGKSKKQ